MKIYKKERFTEEESEEKIDDLIEQLKSQTFRNREMRIEFGKIIVQLASSKNPKAKKLIWKMAEFAKYWENDEMIDEDEWRKLNNTDNIEKDLELEESYEMIDGKKYKKYFFEGK